MKMILAVMLFLTSCSLFQRSDSVMTPSASNVHEIRKISDQSTLKEYVSLGTEQEKGLAMMRLASLQLYANEPEIALASLKDAEYRLSELDDFTQKVEWPLLMGLSLSRVAEYEKSKAYISQAWVGFSPYIREKNNISGNTANLLLDLVKYGQQNVNEKDFPQQIDQAWHMQKFVLACMEMKLKDQAQYCYDQGRVFITDFWVFIQNLPLDSKMPIDLAARDRLEKKVRLSTLYKNLLDRMQMFYNSQKSSSVKPVDLYQEFIFETQASVDKFLYSTPLASALTEESKKLNDAKRPGRLKE